ncbi:hypothetical protein OG920_01800 [Streptomyces europaeiscabiei]|uniref:maltose acetyltransferase domain-containing protein n=1 Tax=Streptomyces europaeiscabiei TaxID=146819 RepID=UPI0030E4FA4B
MTDSHEEEVLARIAKGIVHTESEAAFQAPRRRTEQIFEYNHTPPGETEKRRSLLVAILGSIGERTVLLPPFHAGFGSNVHTGDDFFGNVNLTFADDVDIRMRRAERLHTGPAGGSSSFSATHSRAFGRRAGPHPAGPPLIRSGVGG